MNTIPSPLRRFGATLVIAGIAAFGSVAVAPAALADEPAVEQAVETTPAAPEVPKLDKPVKTPKLCTDKDVAAFAKQQVQWKQQAAVLNTLAAKSRLAADAILAQPRNHSAVQLKRSEAAAALLEKAADAFEAQAAELLDKVAFGLPCTVTGAPRF